MATEPCWDVVIHRSAERELGNVTDETGDELTDQLKQLKYYEQPTEAAYVKHLEDHEDLFRVRVDNYRAICRLAPPQLQVVAVAPRSKIYRKLDTAKDRAGLSD